MDKSGIQQDHLFEGITELVNAYLQVADYRTRTAALELARREHTLDGILFLKALFDGLRNNWERALALDPRASSENFRWHKPQLFLSERNRSPEVTLERAIIRACIKMQRQDWSNQVPLISGIAGAHAYKRRAVDLVQWHNESCFEFVELKVTSDTPLYAAIEITIYGLLWLLSRRDRIRLGYSLNPILEATTLRLSSLAPRDFYRNSPPKEFIEALYNGLANLSAQHDTEMAFYQTAFPEFFQWPGNYTDEELLSALDNREAV